MSLSRPQLRELIGAERSLFALGGRRARSLWPSSGYRRMLALFMRSLLIRLCLVAVYVLLLLEVGMVLGAVT